MGICVVLVSVTGADDKDFTVLGVNLGCMVFSVGVVRVEVAEEVYDGSCDVDVGLGVTKLEPVAVTLTSDVSEAVTDDFVAFDEVNVVGADAFELDDVVER